MHFAPSEEWYIPRQCRGSVDRERSTLSTPLSNHRARPLFSNAGV